MADPWKVEPEPGVHGWFRVTAADGDQTQWNNEALARRYAALPVLIATIRDGCSNGIQCAFCGEHASDGVNTHESDCPGIAALKAAGEEIG